MDYMPGGDFLGLLIRDNVLTEPVTKWYIAEMILCIEEAHALHWIHRDVKPDNFLISPSGHLKISDFGLAFDGHWSHDQAYYNNHRYSLLQKLNINIEGDTMDRKEARTIAANLSLAQVTASAAPGKDNRHQFRSSTKSESEGIINWRNRHSNRTLARSVVGTSQYMAPEVVRGENYDARCDWWSVAIILYEV
jgi:protein-serine/threonine kinase